MPSTVFGSSFSNSGARRVARPLAASAVVELCVGQLGHAPRELRALQAQAAFASAAGEARRERAVARSDAARSVAAAGAGLATARSAWELE